MESEFRVCGFPRVINLRERLVPVPVRRSSRSRRTVRRGLVSGAFRRGPVEQPPAPSSSSQVHPVGLVVEDLVNDFPVEAIVFVGIAVRRAFPPEGQGQPVQVGR